MKTKIKMLLTIFAVTTFTVSCSSANSAKKVPNADNSTYTTETFKNPLMKGADPWITYHDGYYYYCHADGMSKVYVAKAENFQDFPTKPSTLVYTGERGTAYSSEYWAPELHFVNGKWYIYVAADDGNNDNHRMYVLEATTDDPTEPFKMKGKITDSTDKWAIDGTVLEYNNELYFIWSGWAGDVNVSQEIYIAHMSDPWTIDGERILLSTPEYDWETIGYPTVNEGPQILKKGSAVHIIYSASGSWTDDYALGMLTFTGGNILDKSSWKKSDKPVFSKAETAYGPGHCSFIKSADGKEDFIVYHANEVSGSGWNGRTVRAQPFKWQGDTPVFGTPVPVGEDVSVVRKTKNSN